jgi:hypothetical protein
MSTGVHLKTAGDLMRQALRDASISGIALDADEADFEVARAAFNDILSWLQTKQIHLWSETEAFLPLNPNQKRYSFPGDHCFTDYVCTKTTAANVGPAVFDLDGDVLLELDDGALFVFEDGRVRVETVIGMNVGDFVGIELPNGVRWWDTISQIDDEELWFQTTNSLPSFINENASIYTYTTPIDQPVRILDARYANDCDSDEIPTIQLARKDYYDQPSKSTQGAANSWYYDRQLSVGYLNVWPVANRCTEVLKFTFIKPQYIPEDQSENILVPPEWYLPLKNKLAAELGVTYAIDPNKQAILEAKAANYIEDALGTDDEFSSFLFYPDRY